MTRELDSTLPDGLCCWPIGDPADPGFRFCRTPVAWPGQPYCTEHRARAWTTQECKAEKRWRDAAA